MLICPYSNDTVSFGNSFGATLPPPLTLSRSWSPSAPLPFSISGFAGDFCSNLSWCLLIDVSLVLRHGTPSPLPRVATIADHEARRRFLLSYKNSEGLATSIRFVTWKGLNVTLPAPAPELCEPPVTSERSNSVSYAV